MDFYKIKARSGKDRTIEISPDFIVAPSKDLMVRAGNFYAVWDEARGVWSTAEYDVARLVDEDLYKFQDENYAPGESVVKALSSFDSQSWVKFKKFVSSISNSYYPLDENLTFAGQTVRKEDYVSKSLSYPLEPGDYSAWDELVGVLYAPEERAKIEWAIGAVVSGDSKRIQKFLVFYGAPGTGKSTILNVIHKLFYEYSAVFEAKALGNSNNAFATEAFKGNPLVAIQHDGDLSRIEDNTKLNSIIAHEEMLINEKYKSSYMSRIWAMLFMGTNQPVKISDSRSGIIRRLIDINPSGNKIPSKSYLSLMKRIDFELGAIAHHCLGVYNDMGFHYYDTYRPMEMMYKTDAFFNFVEAHYDIFQEEEGLSLKRAWTLYKEYASEAMLPYTLQMHKFKEELKDYFKHFEQRKIVDGQVITSWYSEFDITKFQVVKAVPTANIEVPVEVLKLDQNESILDEDLMLMSAQYATRSGTPKTKWENVETTLSDIDTKKLHYVKVPENHIVIDFDLKDENGEKSRDKNLEAASLWPPTYAEFSQGGAGIHLHYKYEGGEVSELSNIYSDGIEIKTLLGDSSLRRRLSACNNVPVASISSGLPKKEKKMLSENTIQNERHLRQMIVGNLQKKYVPGTKPSIDFIKKLLDEAYENGVQYDVNDMKGQIVAFANNSSNQAMNALKVVQQMKFEGNPDTFGDDPVPEEERSDDKVAFFDVEVYPNLFVVCWKYEGSEQVVRMVNPSPNEVEALFKLKLVGFYNRRYDNHILYARYMGFNLLSLYNMSQALIVENKNSQLFGEAYSLSYADIYDFSSKKQSLKKFMIDLGITKIEMDIPWDQPVPEELWDKVVEYCVNDVVGTEAVWNDRQADFRARQILAELSGLTVNDTTQKHTAKIIFGNDRNPQSKFVYTDLSKEFPGYDFDPTRKPDKSIYCGETVGEGGYVYAEPGMYADVAVLDVASMHPTSIRVLNMFGEYTAKFGDLVDARLAIKAGNYESAEKMLDGRLKPYLGDPKEAKDLAYALKIVINIVYGLTSASFDNPFRDIRNRDNICAKRGALFMIDLKDFVQERGFQVVHIKTDSIKIPNATPEIIEEVTKFGEKYGYDFEHEVTYDKFCLVNDAVYIANKTIQEATGCQVVWDAVGAQFQHPYVYKTMFSGDAVTFNDFCEVKQVSKGVMYLDFEHDKPMALVEAMQFVGRIGRFVPVTQESGGGVLYRVQDDKTYAVTGTKGYLWMEAEQAKTSGAEIDMSYFHKLVDDATKQIEKYGNLGDLIA